MGSERKIIAENLKRVLLKEYLMKEIEKAGFGGIDIQRTPMGTRVTLFCEKPGIVIGRHGNSIKKLTDDLEKKFMVDSPLIEVEDVKNPYHNAQIMAEKLANALERGWHFRRAGHSTVRKIMDSGARGCMVIISGKLTGERHRTEKFRAGSNKYSGDAAHIFVDRGYAVAKLKPGIMGVSVWIMTQEAKLPDAINIITPAPVPATVTPLPETALPQTGTSQVEPSPGVIIPQPVSSEKQINISKLKKLKKIAGELKNLKEQGIETDVTIEDMEEELAPSEIAPATKGEKKEERQVHGEKKPATGVRKTETEEKP